MDLEALQQQLEEIYGSENLEFSGLTKEQLDQREEALAPYRLPQSLRQLYLWHNGLGECDLVPLLQFYPLAFALSNYRTLGGLSGPEGWCPLWFPAFGYEGHTFFVELAKERQDESRVWSFPAEETECFLYVDSVAELVEFARKGWAEKCFTLKDGLAESDPAREAELRGQFCKERLELSAFPDPDWPDEWTQALGRGEEHKTEGATHTIAQALAAKKTINEGRVVGRIVSLMGASDSNWFKLQDDSGELTVVCPESVPGSGQLRMEDVFEVTLEPNPKKPGLLSRMFGWSAPFQAVRVVLVERRP